MLTLSYGDSPVGSYAIDGCELAEDSAALKDVSDGFLLAIGLLIMGGIFATGYAVGRTGERH